MRLSEQLKVIATTDRIRIIQGEHGNREPEFDPDVKILYCGYMGLLEYAENKTEFLARDPEVARMVAHRKIVRSLNSYIRVISGSYGGNNPRSLNSL